MTAKRFIIMDNLPKGTHSNIWDKQKQHNQGIGDELWLGEVVAMLNEGVILAEENEQLKRQIGNLEHTKDFCADVCADCERLEKENEQLKSILKEMVRVSEYNGAISPTRVKCMAYNFIEGLK